MLGSSFLRFVLLINYIIIIYENEDERKYKGKEKIRKYCTAEKKYDRIEKVEKKKNGEKKMFQKFYPSEDINSTYDIDFESYFEKGYRGIIFDVDNTLVFHNAPADERAKALFQRLKKIGFDFCFTSNNKEPRVKKFCQDVGGTHYIYKANKPSTKGYEKAMRLMGTNKENTFFVGDQLFTDVYGANRTGIHSILVKPMNPKEEIQIVLKRYLEKIVLWRYRSKKR